MIAYKYRFHGHGSLRYLYRNGKAIRNRQLMLRFIYNSKRQDSRVSVIISKKIIKSAVGRNRVRRRIYEILRRNWQKISLQTDFAIIVFSEEIRDLPSEDLEKSVIEILKQAKLYHPVVKSAKIKGVL